MLRRPTGKKAAARRERAPGDNRQRVGVSPLPSAHHARRVDHSKAEKNAIVECSRESGPQLDAWFDRTERSS